MRLEIFENKNEEEEVKSANENVWPGDNRLGGGLEVVAGEPGEIMVVILRFIMAVEPGWLGLIWHELVIADSL